MAGIKVRKGAEELENGSIRQVAWLNLTISIQPEAHDLVDGLGSKYYRHRATADDEQPGDRPAELPTELTQRQIADIYREELLHWGTANLATWGDYPSLSFDEQEAARGWLTELVVAAFPEMKEYVR
jgi:hypothetical protein